MGANRCLQERLPLQLAVHVSKEVCGRGGGSSELRSPQAKTPAAEVSAPGLNSASRVSTCVASSFSGKPFFTPCADEKCKRNPLRELTPRYESTAVCWANSSAASHLHVARKHVMRDEPHCSSLLLALPARLPPVDDTISRELEARIEADM